MVEKEEGGINFSLFHGPRPGEIIAERGGEDETPEGSAFLDLVARKESEFVDAWNSRMRGTSYKEMREKLGTVLSLVDRAGSCWWGCAGGGHAVEYALGASAGNALAALRLLTAGYYDESLGLARQIGERANLLQLFLMDQDRMTEWSQSNERERRRRFSAVGVRRALEELSTTPAVHEEHYRYLSGFGTHPGRTPQYFGERFPPTVGGMFRPRGFMISFSELSYAVTVVAGTGIAILSDDDRIPSERIANLAVELLEDQRKLHGIIMGWLADPESEDQS